MTQREWNGTEKVLHHYSKHDLLKLLTIWDGDTLVAFIAGLLDPEKKIYNFYITNFNPEYSRFSPGLVLLSESFKQAIDQHFDTCDFAGGLDPYKLSFSPVQQESVKVFVRRRTIKAQAARVAFKIARSLKR